MKPPPRFLFHQAILRNLVHDLLRKVQDDISTLSYEILIPSQSNDNLVQSLYGQYQFETPYLQRSEAVHDHLQGWLSPYLNLGLTRHQDVRQGIIFYVEVPFTGDARFFDLRPQTHENQFPQGHVEGTDTYSTSLR